MQLISGTTQFLDVIGNPITGTTQLLGVMGNPVTHSLSPLMHNAAIAHMGLNLAYIPLPVKPEGLGAAIAGFEAIDLIGFNLTIPHKQAILPFLSEISDVAQAVGAVNTVWQTPQGWHGTNTDVEGFLAPLRAVDRDWSETVAVILGNGGAARAVVAGCELLGCAEIYVVGRNAAKLEAFAQGWSGLRQMGQGSSGKGSSGQDSSGLSLQVCTLEQLPALIARADLLVNTTPVGMTPPLEASPVEASVMAELRPGAIAYDLIYVPNPTRFLQLAEAHGAVTIDGLEMLVQQGAAALKIWTGRQDVPIDVMRSVLRSHLGFS